jgi:hypothetical protein
MTGIKGTPVNQIMQRRKDESKVLGFKAPQAAPERTTAGTAMPVDPSDILTIDEVAAKLKVKQTPQQPPSPKSKNLFTIPEAAVELCTTVYAVRRHCRSGELRYSQPGHPMLISPQAIKDCIRLMEAKAQLKRELKVAHDAARKEKLRALKASRIPVPHTYPCLVKRCLECAKERGRQAAQDLRKSLVANG